MERYKKRIEAGDAEAISNTGCHYYDGSKGLPQDYDKAMELWRQAGELGCAESYFNIANAYFYGQ